MIIIIDRQREGRKQGVKEGLALSFTSVVLLLCFIIIIENALITGEKE